MLNRKLIGFSLVVLILIVSIGVVSAGNNSTSMELSSDESAQEKIAQSQDMDIISDDDTSDKNDTRISNYDYKLDMPSYTNPDRIYTISVSEMPKDATGNISISIDGAEKYCQPVSVKMNALIINDLNLDWGIHNSSVKYTGDNKYKGFIENGQFEYNYLSFKVSDEICGDFIDFDVIDGVTGSIKVLIDGKIVYNEKVTGSDSVNLDGLKYGMHTYELRYSGNYKSINKKGKFYYNYVISTNLNDEYQIKYGDEIKFYMHVPDDAKSRITVKINNRTYSTKEGEITLSDFDIGENNITISYEDSKYPKQTFQSKAMVLPIISIPTTVNYEGNDTLYLLMPDSVKGTLNIEIDNNPWKTVELENGKAEILLNNLTIGQHILTVRYTGDFQQYIVPANYTINVIPYLSIPKKMWKDGQNYLIFNASNDFNGNLVLKGLVNDTIVIRNGSAKILLSNLKEGRQTLMAYYENCTWKIDAIIYNESHDWNMKIGYPDQIHDSDWWYNWEDRQTYNVYILNCPMNLTGNFSIYHDGKFCGNYEISEDDPSFGILPPAFGIIGNHTIKITYSGDDYFNPTNATHVYEISNLVCYIYDDKLVVELPSDSTGTITVNVNGKKVDSKKASKKEDGYIGPASYYFTLKNIKVNDVVEVIYSGNYGKLTKKVIKQEDDETDVPSESYTYIFVQYPNDDSYVPYLTKNNVIFYMVEEDAAGELTVEILNKETGKYELYKKVSLNNGMAVVTFPSSKIGKYDYRVHFDGNYKADDVEETIAVIPTFKCASSMKYGEEKKVTITLDNQTQGKVHLYIEEWEIPIGEYDISSTNNVITINKNLIDKAKSVVKYNARHKEYYLPIKGDFYLNGEYMYCGFRINVKFTPKLASKNVVMNYLDGKTFTVKVTDIFGKTVGAGEIINIKVGKTTYKAKTNKKGVATIKLTQTPGKYTIKTTFQGLTVKNSLTVKQVMTLKKVNVKKSAKKLVLQATLKQGKKALKNKVVKFKFNGKTYKAKTNKKGIAKVTIKSSVLKKLKVGKKLTYQATYIKDIVKKTVKVKK